MTAPIEPGHVMSREKYNNIQFEQLANGWWNSYVEEMGNSKDALAKILECDKVGEYDDVAVEDFSKKIRGSDATTPP
jgi:hypothetical protein